MEELRLGRMLKTVERKWSLLNRHYNLNQKFNYGADLQLFAADLQLFAADLQLFAVRTRQ